MSLRRVAQLATLAIFVGAMAGCGDPHAPQPSPESALESAAADDAPELVTLFVKVRGMVKKLGIT